LGNHESVTDPTEFGSQAGLSAGLMSGWSEVIR